MIRGAKRKAERKRERIEDTDKGERRREKERSLKERQSEGGLRGRARIGGQRGHENVLEFYVSNYMKDGITQPTDRPTEPTLA